MDTQQHSLFILFLVLAALVLLVFIYVYKSSKKAGRTDPGLVNPLSKRFWFALIWLTVLAIFAIVTIPQSPYFLFKDEIPARVIHVAAKQFLFFLSDQAIDPENPGGEDSLQLKSGELVEFRVTSLDVNHGFAIYDEENTLIAQTQAMPGYVNLLRWKFEKPGNYKILCLEYCGIAHAGMRSSFTVK
jgi:cytochrome c oxidase subunit 2